MNKFLVIGNPIAHSKSPIIHQQFAEQLNIKMTYDKCLLESDEFEVEIKKMFADGLSGANITYPYKERAYKLCDQVSARAELSKAVNTLYMKSGVLCGDNTDGQGLVQDLLFNKLELQNKHILIIGAGGAVRGCIPSLLEVKPAHITIANRTKDKAMRIVTEMGSDSLSAIGLVDVTNNYDIVINATSLSIYNEIPEMNPCVFENAIAAYDMVYSQQENAFLTWALANNSSIKVIDGLGMLVEQAAEAFYVWHKVRPNTEKIRDFLVNS